MRLFSLLLLLALALPASVAQPTFGVKAGLNVATLGDFEEDPEFVDNRPRLGLVAGAYLRYAFSEEVSVQPEVLYSQKGARLEAVVVQADPLASAKGDDNYRQDFTLDYVEVPILVRYAPQVSPTLDLGFFAGPTLAFKIRESIVFRYGDQEDEYDGDDLFDSTDLGVVLGGDVGSGPFAVDLRYTLGLSNVSAFEDVAEVDLTTSAGGFGSVESLKNGVFSATFVYRIGE